MSINRYMDKQTVLQAYNGILLDNKRKRMNHCCYVDESQNNYAGQKNPGQKKYILYDYIYIEF